MAQACLSWFTSSKDLICKSLRLTPLNYHKICMKSFASIEKCQLVKSSLIITPASQHKRKSLLFSKSSHLMTRCRYESETKRDFLCIKSESGAKKPFLADTKGYSWKIRIDCDEFVKGIHSYWEKMHYRDHKECQRVINFMAGIARKRPLNGTLTVVKGLNVSLATGNISGIISFKNFLHSHVCTPRLGCVHKFCFSRA